MSRVLRHDPGSVGLALDGHGWVAVDALVAAAVSRGLPLDRGVVARIVAESDKQRFALSADGSRIRANQGHSVAIDLGLDPVEPPAELFHGTAARNLASIRATGLRPGRRRHVHLSPDVDTARAVGARHGRPVVLVVRARAMYVAGHVFYLSENGVWLTDAVPAGFITFASD